MPDYDTWKLNEVDSRAFIAALLDPPEPNAALKAAAERYRRQREATAAR